MTVGLNHFVQEAHRYFKMARDPAASPGKAYHDLLQVVTFLRADKLLQHNLETNQTTDPNNVELTDDLFADAGIHLTAVAFQQLVRMHAEDALKNCFNALSGIIHSEPEVVEKLGADDGMQAIDNAVSMKVREVNFWLNRAGIASITPEVAEAFGISEGDVRIIHYLNTSNIFNSQQPNYVRVDTTPVPWHPNKA